MVPVVPEIGRRKRSLDAAALAREEPDFLLLHLPLGREAPLQEVGT